MCLYDQLRIRILHSESRLNHTSSLTTCFVRRIAVSGMVLLLVLVANTGAFAAQCGGFPKGWKSAETQSASTLSHVLSLAGSEQPTAPSPAPCKCTGASCSPAAPSPAPERGAVPTVQIRSILDHAPLVKADRSVSEFPQTVHSTLRYDVVFGVLRPPCGV